MLFAFVIDLSLVFVCILFVLLSLACLGYSCNSVGYVDVIYFGLFCFYFVYLDLLISCLFVDNVILFTRFAAFDCWCC